jgi:hypothetical protein
LAPRPAARPGKATGATYTPADLAAYVAGQLVAVAGHLLDRPRLRILDPALGGGALVSALLEALAPRTRAALHVTAYETDPAVAHGALQNLAGRFPQVEIEVMAGDFLRCDGAHGVADLVIANPPYVRTQVLGAGEAKALARRFGLEGRVDLYQAFLPALVDALGEGGVLAAIVTNRFMTTQGAGALRALLEARLHVLRVWDLGDTKLFDAAVLPAIVVARRRDGEGPAPRFTAIYESRSPLPASLSAASVVDALEGEGRVEIPDGRRFELRQGTLASGGADVWRLSRSDVDGWLAAVAARTWRTFAMLGRVRVGVKTTADRVFIREAWGPPAEEPELLRPLITHEIGRRYRALPPVKRILYPHVVAGRRRAVADLAEHPRAARYLERHRAELEARTYLAEAGRRWYELWVPHDPAIWGKPKLVFRDIAERPTFWLDRTGAVVNGDCYWLVCGDEELLWLAVAVANTTFVEAFYDRRFNNRLYAGRRRFMTQYVDQFPLPDPDSAAGRRIMELSRRRFELEEGEASAAIEDEIDRLTWEAFGTRH